MSLTAATLGAGFALLDAILIALSWRYQNGRWRK